MEKDKSNDIERINESLIGVKNIKERCNIIRQIWELEGELDSKESNDLLQERKVLSHYYEPHTGKLATNGSLKDKNNIEIPFSFSNEELSYLIRKLENIAQNPLIHGFYSHVIWKHNHHRDYAEKAITDYLSILESESYDISTILDSVYAASSLSKKTKILLEETKESIKSLLIKDEVPTWAKSYIITALHKSKFFNSKDLYLFVEPAKKWVKNKDASYFENEKLLLIMARVSQALNLDNKELYLLLAENENEVIEQHKNDFILPEVLFKKAAYYKKGLFNQEYENTMKLYAEAKTQMQFSNVKTDLLDEKQQILVNRYINNFIEEILAKECPIEILKFIAGYSDWFPTNTDVESISQNLYRNSIRQFATVVSVDINGNPKKLDDKGKKISDNTNSFTLYYTIMCQAILIKLLIKAVKLKLFSYNSLISYLENTWLSTRYIVANREEHENESWIKIMQPGLKELCNQFALYSNPDTYKNCNYVLCIDSLIPKIEGSIRDLVRLLGGNTTIEKNGEIAEKTLEQLLNDISLKRYFKEGEILFFKYVLTKDGLNLRNDVAHGFTFTTNYTHQMAVNVFLCIMKVSSITIETIK